MEKLRIREKIAYGAGDAGCAFVWQTVMLFLAFFYTDVYGLSPAHMGTMFLIVRILDAITDPLIGSLADRTKSKFGRYRPYLLWVAIPFAISCILVFYTPDFGERGKLIYAYASYIFLTLMYTMINVPYCAMANTLSSDSNERTSLQSYRFTMTSIAGLVIVLLAMKLVDYIGGGNLQLGYIGAMSVMSSLSVILFLFCFFNVKEKIDVRQTKSGNLKSDLKHLSKNPAWRVLFIQNIIMLVGFVLKDAVIIYYVVSILQRPDLVVLFMVLGKLAGVCGAMLAVPLFGKLDKVTAYQLINYVMGMFAILIFFIPSNQVNLIIVLMVIVNFLKMAASPFLWSMMSDVVDYEKHLSGRSLGGVVFSTNLFSIKFGVALGGAMLGWLLALGGYVGGAEVQAQSALTMINALFTLIPGVIFIAVAAMVNFYPLTEQRVNEVKKSLESVN
ncbi:glycoside-pentoside-hexuronide (GPH):cation symporter [Photobacterium sp. DNB23_23_1]|uniref:Glycoside-pentoside-hexuronide (GPH):cation symporter n=1 Tax=Photobacterium pectinilyticum TaxID=2906793 RepID=A0ABT1N678_9GAMM|nr:glycoside-pentoside-hexuronide (GPH):cation symporter [Photobacterium sp. ZSDE20]MCQ1060047.1 glycoside-pentoside-hexuronide (GPH):cation symporter [Photobacterium sp. ZSDE20]MDD1826976.1 glycoside-pentoside-hexuronide (GPH):cation symporter [Photobacterium sp. ZSDE20]